MSVPFEITVDLQRQVIVQRVFGPMDEDSFAALAAETERARSSLNYPDSVYIRADAIVGGKFTPKMRRMARDTLQEPSLKKLAIVGGGVVARVMAVFLRIAVGDKIRWFAGDEEAMAWLMQGRETPEGHASSMTSA